MLLLLAAILSVRAQNTGSQCRATRTLPEEFKRTTEGANKLHIGAMFDLIVTNPVGSSPGVFVDSFSFELDQNSTAVDDQVQVWVTADGNSFRGKEDSLEHWRKVGEMGPHSLSTIYDGTGVTATGGEMINLNMDLNLWVYEGQQQGVLVVFGDRGPVFDDEPQPQFYDPPNPNNPVTVILDSGVVRVEGGASFRVSSGSDPRFNAGWLWNGEVCYEEPEVQDENFGCFRTNLDAPDSLNKFIGAQGVMFDVKATADAYIEEFYVEMGSVRPELVMNEELAVFITNDRTTHEGKETDNSTWTQISSQLVSGGREFNNLRIPLPERQLLRAGEQVGFYITFTNTNTTPLNRVAGAIRTKRIGSSNDMTPVGDLIAEDTQYGALQILSGQGLKTPFVLSTPNFRSNRHFRGAVCFSALQNPTPFPI